MRNKNVFYVLIATSAVFLYLNGCKDTSTGPAYTQPVMTGQNTVTISMAGSAFSPASQTITRHTTIIWNNNSGITHTSTSNTNVWNTGDIAPGGSATTTFDSTGTYPYHCRYHSMMVGTITVQ
jgi:plastocyanin